MCLGIPGQIIEIVDKDKKLAKVDVAGVKRQVSVAFIVNDQNPIETCVGAWVLVHVGFAMSKIDQEEAIKTLALLNELGEVQKELETIKQSQAAIGS